MFRGNGSGHDVRTALGNHRAEHRSPHRAAGDATPVGGTRSAGGRRKATRHKTQTNVFRKIPAVPSLIGAVAIIAAAGGAIGMGPGNLNGTGLQLSAGSDNFSGTDAFTFTGNDARSLAISRDSERQALKVATARSLQATVDEQSAERNSTLQSLAADAQKRADEIAKNLWVLPTVGYVLTARFGQSSGLWSHLHTGLDFAAPTGTPIFAIADGVITFTGYDGSYGNKTVETLPDGTQIWYAHQSEIDVTVGQHVIQSAQIGRIGSTGNTTGPHVHIEVRPGGGAPVDPYPEFLLHGVTP
ncbi:MAG: Glycyl-glycine endopeptidase precursor [Marmoricola sp.]|nr:Glycyl-glycine endopeptidase precursor [Marmoricola sp.]